MNNIKEFRFQGKQYLYELDGYKPLGVQDEDGNDVYDEEVYQMACRHAAEYLQENREYEAELFEHDPPEIDPDAPTDYGSVTHGY